MSNHGARSGPPFTYLNPRGDILLTTHNLEEAEALASRIVPVARGRVAASGSVAEIRSRADSTTFACAPSLYPWLDAAVGVAGRARVSRSRLAEPGGVEELVHKGVPLDDLVVARHRSRTSSSS